VLTRLTGFTQQLVLRVLRTPITSQGCHHARAHEKTTPHRMPPAGTLPNPHFHTATVMLSASCNLHDHSFQIKKPWRRS
ncbi:hypothetical protein AB4Z50_36170, partial [Paenibacillus sp. 2TAB26]|uniref:hypothetical protein n=1 Tax=Paenibacillus sp. 2TAB26 TaxID=3233005 RepID=UPI003F9E08E9